MPSFESTGRLLCSDYYSPRLVLVVFGVPFVMNDPAHVTGHGRICTESE